jgi:hypothetical protein
MYSFKCKLIYFIFLVSVLTASAQTPDSLLNLDRANRDKTVRSIKDNYLFVYDRLYDMTGSAQDLLSVSKLFGRGLDELTCHTDKKKGIIYCCEKYNFFGRVFIDGLNFFFTDWLSTIQHEWNGHGFRAREFNARINRYIIAPFWAGGPHLDFHKEDLPYYGILLEETGGSESNTIFSRESFRQSLLNGHFHHYDMYSIALKVDLSLYIFGTPKVGSNEWISPTHWGDIVRYIKAFKSKSNVDEQHILKSAHRGAYWSLADPSLLISLFNYTRDYIIRGKAQFKNPMIKIKNIEFLPFTDFHLSPFGFEYYVGSYVKYNKTLFEPYYCWSNGNIDGKSYGLGMNLSNLAHYHNFRFDAGFDLWSQGFNLLYYEKDDNKYRVKVLSGKINLKTICQINRTFSLLGQVSYKGNGFLLGDPVKRGFNAKIGLGFYF